MPDRPSSVVGAGRRKCGLWSLARGSTVTDKSTAPDSDWYRGVGPSTVRKKKRMPVPTYDQFNEPVLRSLTEHPQGAPARDVHDAAATSLRLSDADRAEVLPSGSQRVYKNRSEE